MDCLAVYLLHSEQIIGTRGRDHVQCPKKETISQHILYRPEVTYLLVMFEQGFSRLPHLRQI